MSEQASKQVSQSVSQSRAGETDRLNNLNDLLVRREPRVREIGHRSHWSHSNDFTAGSPVAGHPNGDKEQNHKLRRRPNTHIPVPDLDYDQASEAQNDNL